MRVASLDLIRGAAVLGILAINIAGFAEPSIATVTPNLPHPAGAAGEIAFAFGFVLFEGKMRALFAMLFGASMALFMDRADAQGRNGDLLQARRLAWLMLFGLLHYFLVWWGDILFAYAVCGMVLLLMHRMPARLLLSGAALLFLLVHGQGLLMALPTVGAEEWVRLGRADPQQLAQYRQYQDYVAKFMHGELTDLRQGYTHIVLVKLRDHPFWPITGVRDGFGEFVPLMTLGMVLQRSGFFAGAWSKRMVQALGIVGTVTGLLLTCAALHWLWPRHFPVAAMDAALRYGMAPAHVLSALGYAALLVLAAPRLSATWLGRRLTACGQMAFSNYIGTSLIMTAIFYGWGLGLFGRIGPAGQWGFVLLGWTLMLACSEPWLALYRRGPLEWLWRSLAEGRWLANRR